MNGNDNFSSIAKAAGITDEKTLGALKENKKLRELLNSVSNDDMQKLLNTLSDKQALGRLLADKRTAQLISQLTGGGKNG